MNDPHCEMGRLLFSTLYCTTPAPRPNTNQRSTGYLRRRQRRRAELWPTLQTPDAQAFVSHQPAESVGVNRQHAAQYLIGMINTALVQPVSKAYLNEGFSITSSPGFVQLHCQNALCALPQRWPALRDHFLSHGYTVRLVYYHSGLYSDNVKCEDITDYEISTLSLYQLYNNDCHRMRELVIEISAPRAIA